jgi:hypothetical protein
MNVVQMPTGKTADELIALLERLLEMTEEGEMTDIAVACMFRDKSATTSLYIGHDPIGLLGAINVLQHRVLSEGIP